MISIFTTLGIHFGPWGPKICMYWACVGLFGGPLGLILAHLGPNKALLGLICAQIGLICAHLCTNVAICAQFLISS